jgi:hypothetical protein
MWCMVGELVQVIDSVMACGAGKTMEGMDPGSGSGMTNTWIPGLRPG